MMRDCANTAVREQLPDLLNDRLTPAVRAEIHTHLNSCADCRAELAILEQVRASGVAPRVDTARIAAALPPYRKASPWRFVIQSPALRIAAAIVLLAGGSWLIIDRSRDATDPTPVSPVVVTPVPGTVGETARVAESPRPVPTPRPATELAVGEMFDDLTDAELQALLDALGGLEAVTSEETEIVLPAVGRAGGA